MRSGSTFRKSHKFKMSVWTRTFYDRDCVAEALVAALVFKHPLRKQHALFWAHELWVSEEVELLQKCLTKAFLQIPPFVHGLQAWKALKSEESSLLKFIGLLLGQPALSPGKGSNQLPLPTPNILKQLVQKAEVKGQTSRLFLLLEGMSVKDVTAHLSAAFLKRVDPALLKAWRQYGKGLTWVLGVPEQAAGVPLHVEWPKRTVSSLSSRTFRTPKRKHHLNPSPFGVFSGCAVWQRILKEAGLNFADSEKAGELVFETSDAEIAFYATYFPHDIPDEWPVSEKEKGHTVS